jgi:hypothetical protein
MVDPTTNMGGCDDLVAFASLNLFAMRALAAKPVIGANQRFANDWPQPIVNIRWLT